MSYSGVRSLNGTTFEKMVQSGLNNLILNEKKVNDMNVFPVADGDTGRNMRLTLENGVKNAESDRHFGKYAKSLSKGMLFGARGNSGVILSQIFKGISSALLSDGIVNPGELCSAFINGYKTAYEAVVRPVEGTILTVAREGVENIRKYVYGNITIEATLDLYLSEMKKTLEKTPEMLSVLKDSGVLDSGAYGYVLIIEGMLKFLRGEEIVTVRKEETNGSSNVAVFNEKTPFTLGYCMEYLLQLKAEKGYDGSFDKNLYIEKIEKFGNSVVVVIDGSIVKTHIHTFRPSYIMEIAESYGDFISFKLENMQISHNENYGGKIGQDDVKDSEKAITVNDRGDKKEFGIIVCADGSGTEEALLALGADMVLPSVGGNASAGEFVNALKKLNAKHAVIFPNDVNAVRSAEQAVKLFSGGIVTVIPTASIAECYYALSMDIPEFDAESRVAKLSDGAKDVITVQVATSVKDFGTTCKRGDKIAFIDKKIVSASDDLIKTAVTALRAVKGIENKTAVIIFGGKDIVDGENLADEIAKEFPDIEIAYVFGGQSVYELILGII